MLNWLKSKRLVWGTALGGVRLALAFACLSLIQPARANHPTAPPPDAQPSAARCASDDASQRLCLPRAAQRIAALSPGATELLWAAGAGGQVIARVEFSDYPPAATRAPSLGSHTRIDVERLAALQPDLAIAWISGNPAEQVAAVRALKIPVFAIEPRDLEGIASVLERLATLAGSEAAGYAHARQFRSGIQALRDTYAQRAPVGVFYQIWDDPLMTINDQHVIGKVIQLCGGANVFGHVDRLVPRLTVEAVLAANPEVIVAGGMGEDNPAWLQPWQSYTALQASQRGNLFFIPPSLLQRPTPRMLDGARLLCEHLERARGRR